MEELAELEEVSRSLGVEAWRVKGALMRGTIQYLKGEEPPSLIFRKDMGPIERGTVVFLGDGVVVIRGFPKIKRAFYLGSALRRHFRGARVAVEEKMNGYNVRLFRLQNRVFALTRGGYICPYTTKRLGLLPEIESLLRARDVVLCGEVVGLENPYVTHSYPEAEKFGFFTFDIREKGSNRPWPIAERNALLEAHRVPRARLFGVYELAGVAGRVFEIIKALAKESREGVVLKDPEMVLQPIKYTSSQTNIGDLRYAFSFPYDYGVDFFLSRIMREGYQALEMGEGGEELEERARRLGESLLYPMVETIRRINGGEEVTEDSLVRVEDLRGAERLVEYLKKQRVNCVIGEVKEEGGELLIRIKRLKPATNDKVRSVLRGDLA